VWSLTAFCCLPEEVADINPWTARQNLADAQSLLAKASSQRKKLAAEELNAIFPHNCRHSSAGRAADL
jgi:hypothetical protein